MNFTHPQFLQGLWLLPLALLIIRLANKKRQKRLDLFSASRLEELTSFPLSRFKLRLKEFLFLTSLAAIILALARPRWGFEWKELPRGGLDLMVALDLSTSMLANDISPNRLERAKREIIDLTHMLEGDRLGIVAFAGLAFVQCPLTVDYRLVDLFVSQLDINLMPVQGTAIGEAIRLATDSLSKASAAASQGKAIILITDGEDQSGTALAAAKEAQAKGIRIYAIGIGKEDGAPIPLPEGGFKKDRSGNLILSKLDEPTLEQIALSTGGMYVRSTTGELDLEQIYRQGIRSTLLEGQWGESEQKIWYERFQWFVGLALLLLLWESFISPILLTRP